MSEFPFPLTDPNTGKVICQICGKPYLVITPTHLKTHKIGGYDEYTKRFPGAPLSNDEFKKRGSVGKKVKDAPKELFAKEMNPILKVEDVFVDDIEPEIEEVDIEQIFAKDVSKDPIHNIKLKVLDMLKMYFANVEENFVAVLKNSVTGLIYREYITDFADPILRIDFEFPDTYWHNGEGYPDALRDKNMADYGWRVIRIRSNSPTIKDIENAVTTYSGEIKR